MSNAQSHKGISFSLLLLIIAHIFMTACGSGADISEPQPSEFTLTPELTPTTEADRVVLVLPPDSDQAIASQAEALLKELSANSGLELEVRQKLESSDITQAMKVVVFLDLPENLGSLAASHSSTQFVAVTDEDWNPSANAAIIRMRESDVAFIAGYIAAMLAPNYRVGALLSAEKTAFNEAFANGVYYYCGICASQLYPLHTYPVTAVQPAGSPPSAWQTAFDQINANKVNVLYVANEAVSAELCAYLSTHDIALIGSQPPLEECRPRWSATIFLDGISPLSDIWPEILAGNAGGRAINAAISISDNMYISVQDGLVWLSEGKFNFAKQTIDLLRNNKINPLPID